MLPELLGFLAVVLFVTLFIYLPIRVGLALYRRRRST